MGYRHQQYIHGLSFGDILRHRLKGFIPCLIILIYSFRILVLLPLACGNAHIATEIRHQEKQCQNKDKKSILEPIVFGLDGEREETVFYVITDLWATNIDKTELHRFLLKNRIRIKPMEDSLRNKDKLPPPYFQRPIHPASLQTFLLSHHHSPSAPWFIRGTTASGFPLPAHPPHSFGWHVSADGHHNWHPSLGWPEYPWLFRSLPPPSPWLAHASAP